MKLPDAPPASKEFKNAIGSDIPKEFALAARKDIDAIDKMAETKEEKEDLTKEAMTRQYVICVDKSGSMSFNDKNGRKRWMSAKMAVEALIPVIFKYDADGSVPLYLFGSDVDFVGECTKPEQIAEVFDKFQPGGTTNLSSCLEEAMGTYLGTKRANYEVVPGTTFIVLLDGGADDADAVKSVMKKYADPKNGFVANHTQAAISFVQIADDPTATRFLQGLDDMNPPETDICDCVKDDLIYEKGGIDKLLTKAIFD